MTRLREKFDLMFIYLPIFLVNFGINVMTNVIANTDKIAADITAAF